MSKPTSLRLAAVAAASLSLFACATDADFDDDCAGGKCDGADQSCSDPKYGDGVCQTQLGCAIPDIDCFKTFEDDATAATWFAAWEKHAAQVASRAERGVIAQSDPRFQRARTLLDRGWAAFREHRPVGKLGEKRPALVVVDDQTVNAFVIPDEAAGKSAFAVMVHTGVLTNPDLGEDANVGLMMHELQHAVGLHLIGEGGPARFRRFYVAPYGGEPIGKLQPDAPMARTYGHAWLEAATEVGPYDDAALGGLVFAGNLNLMFMHAFKQAAAQNPSTCQSATVGYEALVAELSQSVDPLDSTLALPQDVSMRVTSALSALRTGCFTGYSKLFLEVLAEMTGTSVPDLTAGLSPDDRLLIANKAFFEALVDVAVARRSTMRAARRAFEMATRRPWSALRYFSFEEDADDVTVPTLRAAGFAPDGQGQFLLPLIAGDAQRRCKALLDAKKVPPYGVDLSDEHHATCWRVYHIRELAKRGPERAAPSPTTPTLVMPNDAPIVTAPTRLPIPMRPDDTVVY